MKPALCVAALLLVLSCDRTGARTGVESPESSPATARVDDPGHRRMLELLGEIAENGAKAHPYLGDHDVPERKVQLAALGESAPVDARWNLLAQIGLGELRTGAVRGAIAHFSAAVELLPRLSGAIGPLDRAQIVFYLGVAYMRLGEVENCCARNTPESCILPLRGNALHTKEEGSRGAIRYFTQVIEKSPKDTGLYLSALWLLNVMHMTVGEYPDGVPAAYRIPERAFRSQGEFPRFEKISTRLGIDSENLSGSVVADDLDGDGDIDIFTTTWDVEGEPRLFVNRGDGTFEDRTAASGLTGLHGGLNAVQADYDNDGDLDLLVLRGAWGSQHGRHPNSLLANDGSGSFTDVTFRVGLGEVHLPTQTAAWADYDLDGDLDLCVGNETEPALRAPCQLFENDGDGTFTDVAARAGVENLLYTKGVVWGDYDGDRYPDLFVSNLGGANRLYHNDGDGTFTDVAPDLGMTAPERSFPAWFWDFDNDGALDIFVSSYDGGISQVAAHALGLPPRHEPARLYQGDGKGGFLDVAAETGLDAPMLPMGSNFGDLDNDGFLDVYLGTGDPRFYSLVPNLLYRNQGGKRFVDVSIAAGVSHLQKGHAVAFADFDRDGDLDIFEQMGGAFPGDAYRDAYYENPGFEGTHWLGVRLEGRRSNRSAIGARIRATFQDGSATRSVYRHVTSGGSFGANPLRQTLGLGAATRVGTLEIYWPASDLTQTFLDVAADQVIRIVEGAEEYERIEPGRRARTD